MLSSTYAIYSLRKSLNEFIVSTVLIGRLAVLYYSLSLPNWMRWL